MRQILILTNKKSYERDEKTFLDFLDTEERASYEVSVACLEDLLYLITSNPAQNTIQSSARDIASFDLVWIKRSVGETAYYAQVCALYLDANNVTFLSSDILVKTSAEYNKLKEHMLFSLDSLPIPETKLVNKHNIDAVISEQITEYPVVMKSVVGSRGRDNFLLHSAEEIRKVMSENEQEYLVQPYIQSEIAYRVLVFGYSAKLCIRKINQDPHTHINTVAQGADSDIVPLESVDQEILSVSEQAAKCMNREIAGTDIIIDKATQKVWLLEANRPPSIESGQFASQKVAALVTYLKSIVEDR